MSYDECCRLHYACLAMAKETITPDVRDRWLALASTLWQQAAELRDGAVITRAQIESARRPH
jgi:hypothetical protein